VETVTARNFVKAAGGDRSSPWVLQRRTNEVQVYSFGEDQARLCPEAESHSRLGWTVSLIPLKRWRIV